MRRGAAARFIAPIVPHGCGKVDELFWTAHTDPKDAWQTKYRFTGS
jgi:hypothetical protein